jgi:hypothetical protein
VELEASGWADASTEDEASVPEALWLRGPVSLVHPAVRLAASAPKTPPRKAR